MIREEIEDMPAAPPETDTSILDDDVIDGEAEDLGEQEALPPPDEGLGGVTPDADPRSPPKESAKPETADSPAGNEAETKPEEPPKEAQEPEPEPETSEYLAPLIPYRVGDDTGEYKDALIAAMSDLTTEDDIASFKEANKFGLNQVFKRDFDTYKIIDKALNEIT